MASCSAEGQLQRIIRDLQGVARGLGTPAWLPKLVVIWLASVEMAVLLSSLTLRVTGALGTQHIKIFGAQISTIPFF